MHDLPDALFGSKDRRSPKSKGRDLLPCADLGLCSLDVHNAGKLSTHILLYHLDAKELAICELRCGMLLSLRNLLPSMRDGADSRCGRAKGVREAYIFPMGEQLLRRFGVSFQEFIARRVPLLK